MDAGAGSQQSPPRGLIAAPTQNSQVKAQPPGVTVLGERLLGGHLG